MRVLLSSFGTRGDLEPVLALGRGLAARGHAVRVAAEPAYAARVKAWRLELVPVGDCRDVAARTDALAARMHAARFNPLRVWRELGEYLAGLAEAQIRDCADVGQWADVHVATSSAFGAPHLAEAAGAPFVRLALQPAAPTRTEASVLFPVGLRLGPVLNRFSHSFPGQVLHRVVRARVDRARREILGLAPTSAWLDLLGTPRGRPARWVLGAYSRELVPRPVDAPESYQVVGELWHPSQVSLDAALQGFLDAGDPPLYAGFGSAMLESPETMAGQIRDAAARVGARVVLAGGWAGLALSKPSPHVHCVNEVPHDALLPRCAGAMHHGSAGSTHASLRHGLPTWVAHHGIDQPYWGARVGALGVGPRATAGRKLTTDRIADAFRRMLHDPGMRARATDLGARIRAEAGVERAVDFIERA